MSQERLQSNEPFGFAERERLNYRLSDARFRTLIEDERTTIHSIELSANNYGEFLFVTVSLPEQSDKPVGERGSVVTMYGMGFHDYRERWITAEWFWYEVFSRPELLEKTVEKASAQQRFEERRQEIAPYLTQATQTRRGEFFELLAELTDEDGAIAELEDLGELDDWIDDPIC